MVEMNRYQKTKKWLKGTITNKKMVEMNRYQKNKKNG
jgi:hypothetical protein